MNYHFDLGILLAGKYHDWLLAGTVTTLKLAGVSLLLALCVGFVITLLRLSPLKILRGFALVYVEFIRNTPLLVQIFFWYFGATQILPEAFNQWLYRHDFEFAAAAIALTLYTAAFMAEDLRSGIRSIPREQMEAARASGFGYLAAMRHVVLPQAWRVSVPPLINQTLNLTKNSSLAMAIGVAELTYQARQIESYTFKSFEAFAAATAIYLAVSLVITLLAQAYEARVLRAHA
ncbi:MAG: amino acid ABC transporter permease [Burkholderiales bacterium]